MQPQLRAPKSRRLPSCRPEEAFLSFFSVYVMSPRLRLVGSVLFCSTGLGLLPATPTDLDSVCHTTADSNARPLAAVVLISERVSTGWVYMRRFLACWQSAPPGMMLAELFGF